MDGFNNVVVVNLRIYLNQNPLHIVYSVRDIPKPSGTPCLLILSNWSGMSILNQLFHVSLGGETFLQE